MALGEQDHEIIRQYLLGKLTDDEQLRVEERLLSEDTLFQELEVTKDELAQEYVGGQLSAKEREWLHDNFLASPEGKQRQEFAENFDRYARIRRAQHPKGVSLIERLRALLTVQSAFVRAATASALVVITVGVLWLVSTPAPQSIATLTLTNSSTTRSTDGGSVPGVRLKEDVLKLTLILPQPGPSTTAYRFELMNDAEVITTLQTKDQDTQSVSVEIPAAQLPRGQYVATLSTLDANGNARRIPGSYHFKVE